jgi:hypothetical protein
LTILTISTDFIQIINLAVTNDISLQSQAQGRWMSQFGDAKESDAINSH